jgi:cyclase
MQEAGAGEILLTSMDQDGTKKGFDIELTKAMSDALEIPIIASGGVGAVNHFVDGALQGGADALLAASVFHYGEMSVNEVKQAMSKAGIEVRL